MDPRPDGPIDWDELLGWETDPVVEYFLLVRS